MQRGSLTRKLVDVEMAFTQPRPMSAHRGHKPCTRHQSAGTQRTCTKDLDPRGWETVTLQSKQFPLIIRKTTHMRPQACAWQGTEIAGVGIPIFIWKTQQAHASHQSPQWLRTHVTVRERQKFRSLSLEQRP